MISIKQGRKRAKALLSVRFQEAIDSAAMRGKAVASDAYLEDWRSVEQLVDDGDLQAAVDHAAQALEARYDADSLAKLIKNQGYQS